ncbi:MAG: hypothetical protein QXD77_01555 [Candidatus Aenigmatarchaeota archaeon]
MQGLKILVATEDAAMSVLNAAVAAQAVDLKEVEVYTASVENLTVLDSYLHMSGFLFPVPHAKCAAYAINFSSADEDDLKLLNDSLDHYFGVRPQKSYRDVALEKTLAKKGYPIELVKPHDLYVRVRLRAELEGEDVDAFLGRNFVPSRQAFLRLREGYPGIRGAIGGDAPQKTDFTTQTIADAPAIEVIIKMVEEARRKDRTVAPPSVDDLLFFRELVDAIYMLPDDGRSLAMLDRDMISDFAECGDVAPRIRSMAYSKLFSRDNGRFKSAEELLAEFASSF